MDLTLDGLRLVLERHTKDYTFDKGKNWLTYAVKLIPENALLCGRPGFTVTLKVQPNNTLIQIAVSDGSIASADVPLAVAAVNACNCALGWPTSILYAADGADQYDLRFIAGLDVDSGVTSTIDDAVKHFPTHVRGCLTRIHRDFGL